MSEINEWTIAVTGDMINDMKPQDRKATIVEPVPAYIIDAPGSEGAAVKKIKMVVNVKLVDGRIASYYPNMTSGRFIAAKLKADLSADSIKKWVGKIITWGKILDQKVGGQDKKVLYVTDVQ
jgi:hypothetical protein